MVYLKYLEREVHPATYAVSLLLSKEDVLVLAIGLGLLYVGPLGNVGPGGDIAVVKQTAHGLLEPDFDQFHGLRGYVYPYPLPAQPVGGNAGSGASTEGV